MSSGGGQGPPPGAPHRIVHIARPEDWEAARTLGRYTHPSLRSEGFIHCSTPDQLEATVARHFEPGTEVVLLELDPSRLDSPDGDSPGPGPELRWERSGDHGVFPHVFGPIPLAAVVAEHRWNTGRELPAPLGTTT